MPVISLKIQAQAWGAQERNRAFTYKRLIIVVATKFGFFKKDSSQKIVEGPGCPKNSACKERKLKKMDEYREKFFLPGDFKKEKLKEPPLQKNRIESGKNTLTRR